MRPGYRTRDPAHLLQAIKKAARRPPFPKSDILARLFAAQLLTALGCLANGRLAASGTGVFFRLGAAAFFDFRFGFFLGFFGLCSFLRGFVFSFVSVLRRA